MLHVEWYHVCWPRLTAKRVEPVVSISWASCQVGVISMIVVFYDVYSLRFCHRLIANPSRYIHINNMRKFSPLFNNSVGKCCLHSFYYIFFDLLPLQCQHPLPWSESELTILGTKVPRNIHSREQKFPGTKVSGSESSRELLFLGAKVPTGNFR